MILEATPVKNFYQAKVKGNFQDFYATDLVFKKNAVETRCNCPLKEEWCKHTVAVALKAIEAIRAEAISVLQAFFITTSPLFLMFPLYKKSRANARLFFC
jgi:uncharacterized Zn finger protein